MRDKEKGRIRINGEIPKPDCQEDGEVIVKDRGEKNKTVEE